MITDTTEVLSGTSGNTDYFLWVAADMPEEKYQEEWHWDFDHN
jgi:hypothetical protein